MTGLSCVPASGSKIDIDLFDETEKTGGILLQTSLEAHFETKIEKTSRRVPPPVDRHDGAVVRALVGLQCRNLAL